MYANPECVSNITIGDAGSVDGTSDLVEQFDFGAIPKIVYKAPVGNIALNIRMGAERATGQYIIVVGNDILMAPHFTESALSTIRESVKHGINIVAYDDDDNRLRFYGEPVNLSNGVMIKRSKNVGGLVIIPRDKILQKGAGGYLGDTPHKYEGWQIWYRAYKDEMGMMFPRLGCFDMLRIATKPRGFEYIQTRRTEPLVLDLLLADPLKLEREYVFKGWSRNHPLDKYERNIT